MSLLVKWESKSAYFIAFVEKSNQDAICEAPNPVSSAELAVNNRELLFLLFRISSSIPGM